MPLGTLGADVRMNCRTLLLLDLKVTLRSMLIEYHLSRRGKSNPERGTDKIMWGLLSKIEHRLWLMPVSFLRPHVWSTKKTVNE